MARSKSFFGKRRGRVGDLIFSVLNGNQITKQAPAAVANPKSNAQTVQRMKLTPSQKFYDAFEQLLNHSWQNVKYGSKSRNNFMSLAMKRNGGPYIARGVSTLIPGTYNISSGSLGAVSTNYVEEENMYETSLRYTGGQGANETHDSVVRNLLANNTWLESGDKVTFLFVYKDNDGADTRYIPIYRQLRLSEDGSNEIGGGNESVEIDDWTAIAPQLASLSGKLAMREEIWVRGGGISSDNFPVESMGFIVSRGDKTEDRRTSGQMAVSNRIYTQYYSDEAYRYAISTYQSSAGVSIGDEWILNTDNIGLYGRVVTRRGTITYQGDTFTFNYLNLVFELAGNTEERILIRNVRGSEFLVGTDGGYIVAPYDGNFNITLYDLYPDGANTLPWNDAYMQLFNGGNRSASISGEGTVNPQPIPALKVAPTQILEAAEAATVNGALNFFNFYLPYTTLPNGNHEIYNVLDEENKALKVTYTGAAVEDVQYEDYSNIEGKTARYGIEQTIHTFELSSISIEDFDRVKKATTMVDFLANAEEVTGMTRIQLQIAEVETDAQTIYCAIVTGQKNGLLAFAPVVENREGQQFIATVDSIKDTEWNFVYFRDEIKNAIVNQNFDTVAEPLYIDSNDIAWLVAQWVQVHGA